MFQLLSGRGITILAPSFLDELVFGGGCLSPRLPRRQPL